MYVLSYIIVNAYQRDYTHHFTSGVGISARIYSFTLRFHFCSFLWILERVIYISGHALWKLILFFFLFFQQMGSYTFSHTFSWIFFSFTSKSLSRFTQKKIFVKFFSRVPHIFDQIVIINPSKSIRPTLSTHSKSMDICF